MLYLERQVAPKDFIEVWDDEGSDRFGFGAISLYTKPIKEMEDEIIRYVLESSRYDQEETCKLLEISKTILWRKTKRLKMNKITTTNPPAMSGDLLLLF